MQKHNQEDGKVDFDFYERQIEEQKEVERYVLFKPLNRPKTNAVTLIIIAMVYVIISSAISVLAINIFDIGAEKAWVYLTVYIVVFCFTIRFFCIKVVECYQHYAKEETRRRCLCMPTCSEYAILALKKYCFIVALLKIRKRLFKTCTGGFYKKDLLR